MSEVKYVSMFITPEGHKMVVDMGSRERDTETRVTYFNTYTDEGGWVRRARKDILAMEEVLAGPECTEFMESLVDEDIIFRRWQYQIML